MKPTENGYYWLVWGGRPKMVVLVLGHEYHRPVVLLPGTPWTMELELLLDEQAGCEWSGPLVSPWEQIESSGELTGQSVVMQVQATPVVYVVLELANGGVEAGYFFSTREAAHKLVRELAETRGYENTAVICGGLDQGPEE